MGVQGKAKASGKTYRRGTLAVAIGRGLASKVLASAVLLVPMASQAADECGASKQCTAAGNPYPSGIVYGGENQSVTLKSGAIVAPISVGTSHTFGISFGVVTAWNTQSRTGTTSGTIEAGASVTSALDGIVGAALRDKNLQFTNHGDIVLTGANTQGVVMSPYQSVFPLPFINFINTGTISATHAVSLGWGRSSGIELTASNSGSIHATTGTAFDFGVPYYPDALRVTFTNTGTIDSEQNSGVYVTRGQVTGSNAGTITGDVHGLVIVDGSSYQGNTLFTNTGTLRSAGTLSDPDVFNHAGLYVGGPTGVRYENSGLIEGPLGINAAGSGQLFFNSGEIHGTDGYAIAFQGNNNTLTLQTGSELIGDVTARASDVGNTIVLNGTGAEDSAFSQIHSLRMNGTTWELSGAFTTKGAIADATRVDAGTLIVTGQLTNTNGGVTTANGGTLQLGNGGLIAF
jgi:hypothetical protein